MKIAITPVTVAAIIAATTTALAAPVPITARTLAQEAITRSDDQTSKRSIVDWAELPGARASLQNLFGEGGYVPKATPKPWTELPGAGPSLQKLFNEEQHVGKAEDPLKLTSLKDRIPDVPKSSHKFSASGGYPKTSSVDVTVPGLPHGPSPDALKSPRTPRSPSSPHGFAVDHIYW